MAEPINTTIDRLRKGKAALRSARRLAPLEDKFEDLWRVQQLYVQIVGSQRPLKSWQQPWDIMTSRVYNVVIDKNIEGAEGPTTTPKPSSSVLWSGNWFRASDLKS